MEACDAFVALDSDLDFGRLRNLLDGKIITDGARAVPDKVMDKAQGLCIPNKIIEQVVDRSLDDPALVSISPRQRCSSSPSGRAVDEDPKAIARRFRRQLV